MAQTIQELQRKAIQELNSNARNYYESGGDDEQTLSENCRAFDRLHIRQQCGFRTQGEINNESLMLDTQVFGQTFDIPIGIAPIAMQKMAHDGGEIASAKAASSFGACNIVPTLSTTSYEDVVKAVPSGLYWAQLYIFNNQNLSKELVLKAIACGFKAIVLTVNTPCSGRRIADVKGKFQLPDRFGLENFSHVKELQAVSSSSGSALVSYVNKNIKRKTWEDVKWLRGITDLPILLKGILTKEEAEECLKHDVQGIIVSNHGGRQLDGVPATIEALPEVVRAVQGKIPVFVDGGIRRGSDVFKALALGAQAVFIGRPMLYGLVDGEDGVKQVFEILCRELKEAMKVTGCKCIKDISSSMVVHESSYGIYSNSRKYPRNWDITPDQPICIEDIREGAANSGYAIKREEEEKNSDAFYRLRFRPHRMRGVLQTDTSIDIYGMKLALPLIICTQGPPLQEAAIKCADDFTTGIEVTKCEKSYSNWFYGINQLLNESPGEKELLEVLQTAEKSGCRGIILNIKKTSIEKLKQVKSHTQLPLIVRGVMTKEIAVECLNNKVNGIIVSDEFSKDFPYSCAPIDVLPEIVEAINYKVPVFLQGGIRKGTDILKALALGARAVFIDQPIQWGFVHMKEVGITKVMDILKEEMNRAMLFLGSSSIREIRQSSVVHESYYWNINNKT